MPTGESTTAPFELIAGRLCLDFVNTVAWGDGVYLNERLNSYADLVTWAHLAGAVSDRDAKRLLKDAGRRPREASAVLDEAIILRRSIREMLAALAHGQPATTGTVDEFNASLSHALAHLTLVPAGPAYEWGWIAGGDDLAQVLWPVVWSAATLVTSDELRLVRECGGESCGWLFLDLSRNRTRRWCDMKGCGNRAKARRHYHRKKGQVRDEPGAASAAPLEW